MWFGDLVTMRWWDDLWLNESFATWAATLAQAEATRWTGAGPRSRSCRRPGPTGRTSCPPRTRSRPTSPTSRAVEVNFDGITYAKGASVLKQLVAYVGRDHFLAGRAPLLRPARLGQRHAGRPAGRAEATSGRDLAGWSKQWLETAGVNTLRPDFELDADGRFTEFAVVQEAPPAHPVLRSHRIAIGLYDRTAAAWSAGRRVETGHRRRPHRVPELAGEQRPDLVLVNDDDLTYAKIRLDEHSLATLSTGIGEFTEPLPAALCWAAAWDMCRDAETARPRLRPPGPRRRPSVTDISVRRPCSGRPRGGAPVHRPGLAAGGAGGSPPARCAACCEQAEPGSDRQLAYVQAFAGVATPRQTWLCWPACWTGRHRIDGLGVDTELRWRLLHRLASQGAAGQAEIDAELERDATDAGERQPPPAAPPSRSPGQGGRLAGHRQRHAVERHVPGHRHGFHDPDHAALLAPYATRLLRRGGRHLARLGQRHGAVFRGQRVPDDRSAERDRGDRRPHRADQPAGGAAPPAHRGAGRPARALRCQELDRQAG